jgi:hypothetical protein
MEQIQRFLLYLLLVMIAAGACKAQRTEGQTSKPLMIVVHAGAAQSFLDIKSGPVQSLNRQLSPLFYAYAFHHKPGLALQAGLGVISHSFSVETISASDRNLNFVYLDIPAGIRYGISPSFAITAGASASLNLRTQADFDLETGRPEPVQKRNETAKSIIGNMKFSANYLSPIGLSIQVGYSKALGNILKDGSDGKTFSYVDVQLGYILFGKHQHAKANDRLQNAGPRNGW